MERERKYQQSKKLRETAEDDWQPKKGGKKVKKVNQDEIDDQDSEGDQQEDAIDMRREDAELEAMLREYNNEGRDHKPQEVLEKPLDLPFYKGIQLPTHLKWVSIFSVRKVHVIAIETK